MTISTAIRKAMERSSWIRKMFEEGAQMKADYGAENVYDFSLGNPDLDPPPEFFDRLQRLAAIVEKGAPGSMPNAGHPHVRESIAAKVSSDHDVEVHSDCVVMTAGAAGALNIIFKAILDPGDEVIVPKPHFVEYRSFISNHNGELVLVDTNEDFSLNLDNISKAINEKTKAVLINTPHNPTGRIYPEADIKALSELLTSRGKYGKDLYLVVDEPYRQIVFDKMRAPSILKYYSQSIVTNSYSKTLSIPGERIGYLAVNPVCKDLEMLIDSLIFCTRALGYVNAPALMQRTVATLNDVTVNVDRYERRRDIFVEGLISGGYSVPKPEGAFYIFCKSPIDDDVEFVRHLLKYNILTVPGSGFRGPGYFRICFAVPDETIERALPKFKEALKTT